MVAIVSMELSEYGMNGMNGRDCVRYYVFMCVLYVCVCDDNNQQGCVPSKALLKCAKVAHHVTKQMKEYGLQLQNADGTPHNDSTGVKVGVDFNAVMTRMRRIRCLHVLCCIYCIITLLWLYDGATNGTCACVCVCKTNEY